MKDAMYQIEPVNFRVRRAQSFSAALMQEIRDVIPTDFDQGEVHDRLMNVLVENGACWTTEDERKEYGFEPRDDLGWTASERVEQKRRELEIMQMMMANNPVMLGGLPDEK